MSENAMSCHLLMFVKFYHEKEGFLNLLAEALEKRIKRLKI